VEARISRCWYGVSADTKFNQNCHGKRRKHWSEIEEEWFVDDKMTWYINKVGKLELASLREG
jgi:hypothetical protein